MSVNKLVFVCACAERGLVIEPDVSHFGEDCEVLHVPDLCRVAAQKDGQLNRVCDADCAVIYACYPRAIRALFSFAGAPLGADVECINRRAEVTTKNSRAGSGEREPAWYPVIDRSRCTSCGQCVAFCLFGVYETDEDSRPVVANPSSCKNNCPACARICPEAAIIFPKVNEEPINGAEIDDDASIKAEIKLKVDEILGDDVYAALNARKKRRKKLLNEKKIEQALAERKGYKNQEPY